MLAKFLTNDLTVWWSRSEKGRSVLLLHLMLMLLHLLVRLLLVWLLVRLPHAVLLVLLRGLRHAWLCGHAGLSKLALRRPALPAHTLPLAGVARRPVLGSHTRRHKSSRWRWTNRIAALEAGRHIHPL